MATIYHGTDISRYQGAIDWAAYAAAKNFVIIKAAGADGPGLYTDSFFNQNQTGARAQAGLRIGYYFFGDARIDAASSANYFINTLGTLNSGEILVLDIEGANYPHNNWAYIFATAIFNFYGFYPFVYMSQFSPTSSALGWPSTNPICPLWMANYSLADTDFSRTTGNADLAWGGLGAPNYRMLQYSSSGVVAGIPHVVDLDSFYSPNNTLADWDNFGFQAGPSPPSPGTLTIATVANPTIVYTQPATQTVNVPTESYDQVLFSETFNTSVTSSTWPVSVNGPPTDLTQYAYPIGNYTYNINGASNLNDYGFINAGDFGQFPGTIPQVIVQPVVDANGNLSFEVTVNQTSGTVTVTLALNIALLAYPNTTTVPLSTVQQQVARTNATPVLPTAYSTYRRIYTESSTGTGATTLGHGLSTIPNLLYWVQDNSGNIEPQPVAWSSTGHTSAFGISMDSTNVYFFVDAGKNTKCWYRLYKDN